MRIGVIADSHDNLNTIKKAAAAFRREGVALVLHAGDHISPFSLAPLKDTGCRVIGVFGNNDGEKILLAKRYEEIGEIHAAPHFLACEGFHIALMHEPFAIDRLGESGAFDLVIYGHTHRKDIRKGKSLVVNPGECGGWLSEEPTVAVVDLPSGDVQVISL
ncbi:MAG: metallophosphoesterase [Candidatus Eremiobacteraeota bacterium]|nr:metallophosphoesterase [Candidatus Eremiobacteraeota bacterium]